MTMAEELASYVGANRTVLNLVAVFTFMASVGWLRTHRRRWRLSSLRNRYQRILG